MSLSCITFVGIYKVASVLLYVTEEVQVSGMNRCLSCRESCSLAVSSNTGVSALGELKALSQPPTLQDL